ncbi:signal peptidase I [Candidatus Beckwithbacteria bacterium]|nr:signal peptidase I [Candidatus Beckwithbacteria bacterium]
MSILKSLTEFFLDFLETIIVALVIFLVLYMFIFQPHQVKGQSMYPTLHNGEYLLTNKLTYRFREPEVGDIIVFRAPSHEELDYIKRIVALPGDRVKLLDGKFYINGYELNESEYLSSDVKTTQERYLLEGTEVVVPPNSYFVAGDNRPNSSDSRDFGPVPYQNIVGIAWFRYWPPQNLGLVQNGEILKNEN